MRLRLLTVVGTMALALAAPSAALAHRHGHHHQRHHKAHHAKFRVMNITPSGISTPASPGTTTPSTPPTEENAGTVASYEKEVLTLTLKDNSTVSGKVTADTRIKCISPNTSTESGDDGGPGDDNGQGDDQERGDMSESGEGSGDQKDGGEDNQGPSTPEPPCDTSSLTPGTVVHSAQLRIGPSGNEWEFVVLVRP